MSNNNSCCVNNNKVGENGACPLLSVVLTVVNFELILSFDTFVVFGGNSLFLPFFPIFLTLFEEFYGNFVTIGLS